MKRSFIPRYELVLGHYQNTPLLFSVSLPEGPEVHLWTLHQPFIRGREEHVCKPFLPFPVFAWRCSPSRLHALFLTLAICPFPPERF